MIVYFFSEWETEFADAIAHLRDDPKEKYGCKPKVPITKTQMECGIKSTFDLHKIGVLAEIAVANTLGCPIRIMASPTKGDPGADIIWNDKKIEVKFSNRHALYVREGRDTLADIFVLVTGQMNEMHIEGWATSEDFKNRELSDYKNYGHREKHIPIYELRPTEELWGR